MTGPDTVDLTVDGIAVGGNGIGRTEDGRVVFVPGTAPGDRVKAELVERRKRWARGRIVEVYERGPGHVEAPCKHFGACGGCRLMHLDETSQLDALRQGIVDTLQRIGHVDVPVEGVVTGGERLRYRNRVTFTVRRRAGRVFAGYHAATGRRLVDVLECPLAEPAVAQAWREIRAAWGAGAKHLPPGGDLRLTLRASASGEIGLLVAGGRDSAGGSPSAARRLQAGVREIAENTTALATYWWSPGDGPRRHLFGDQTLRDTWYGIDLDLLPEAFLQVNREVAGAIEAHLDEGLGPVADRRILDLYAGVGLRALRWASGGATVRAVESNPDAVETARRAARREGISAEFVESSVEAALAGEPIAVDDIVVNPPRSGLSEEAVERLCALPASRLVYVSCDPGTLARDVQRLAGAWTAQRARAFDAFPHTGHVETVLWFERAGEAVS